MKNMYSALDSFLNIRTWSTRHPYDSERFFAAIHDIVRLPGFNPDAMGDYIYQKKSLKDYPEDHEYQRAKKQYVSDAWAIKGYLDFLDKEDV